jgi:chemotaxis protein methyltransferase CheR
MKELSNAEFEKFSAYIKKVLGIKMGIEKKMLIFTRLKTTVEKLGFDDFSKYYDYLVNEKTGAALSQFTNIITTNHTYFMRESEHFDFFEKVVLPELYARHLDSKNLKIWCAGSSSGEEPYTLQFLIQDFFESKPKGWDYKIIASDISHKVLDKAVLGVYSNESLQNLPLLYKKKYFDKFDDSNSIVKDSVKSEVIFRKINLMDDKYPLKNNIHAIFCRNVIIYFDAQTKDEIIDKFHELLEPGGYLFIGHSETISNNKKFDYIMPSVYKKNNN